MRVWHSGQKGNSENFCQTNKNVPIPHFQNEMELFCMTPRFSVLPPKLGHFLGCLKGLGDSTESTVHEH